ncbi:MAG: T9SS type A sorting domain-containing protein [Bacteroidales bacterium]|nr:T9SS type A sorting domain-containing protein [Bacteroidales bacterium]MCF8399612.1 T9SS type A sorting domain-containing protein [Bacteroidales bacterium]
MKKEISLIQFILLPLITISFLAAYHFTDGKLTPRENYEKFLVSEYKQVPQISEEEWREMDKPTRPDLAAMQNFFMTLDPELGRVPTERLAEAYHQTRALENEHTFKSTTSISWEGTGANMGGRTRAMMFDPNDNNNKKLWAGGVTGGLWYNDDITDEDSEWEAVDDFWASLSIACIAHDPNDTDVFFVGTGESQTAYTTYRESSGVGVGIYKSTDGGDSWELMESTEDFKYVNDIVVRNENGTSVVYAGVSSGFYHGVVHQSEPTDGLYRSTDGGESWEQVLPDIAGEDIPYSVSDIALGADNKIYLGTIQNVNWEGGATILTSTSGTSGSWDVYDDIRIEIENSSTYYLPGRVMMMTAPSDENIAYAIIGAGYDEGYIKRYHGKYILKTEDKGNTWEEINKPNSGDWATLAWHALTGSVNPVDPDLLYVGGLDVWNTLNGGWIWYHVSDWALMYYGGGDEYVHADQHAQIYRPGSNNEMVFSSDGGVFYTANAATSSPIFEERNKGFNTLQFYSGAISPVAGQEKYVGGLQDNGSLYYNGDPFDINDMVSGGDGAYAFFDEDTPTLMITSVYYNRFYVFLGSFQINGVHDYSCGIFVNPCDYDSRNNTMYSNAVGFSGSYNNSLMRIENINANESGQFVWLPTNTDTWFSHVKISPHSPENETNLFVGSNSGRLYFVENAETNNPAVTEITGEDFPLGSISCVDVGGSDDTLLVTFSNYGVSSVWQTFDGGQSWQEKEGNLPDMPIRWAIYHPQNTQQAMLATECGIYTTNELGEATTNWFAANDGLANVRVDMLDLRKADNTVLAATHGRGLYTAIFPLDPYTGMDEEIAKSTDLSVYPNPSRGQITVELPDIKGFQILQLFDLQGRMVKEWKNINAESVELDLSAISHGEYLIRVETASGIRSEKILLQ